MNEMLFFSIAALIFSSIGSWLIGFAVGAKYGRWTADENHCGRIASHSRHPRFWPNGDADQDDVIADSEPERSRR